MTVRTWFTISALVLVALVAAVVYQFMRPVGPPEIVLHAGEQRVDGALRSACWPQRSAELRCTRSNEAPRPQRIAAEGEFGLVLISPAQPKTGSLRVVDERGRTVLRSEWERRIEYDLEPGDYGVTAEGGDPDGAFVRYAFAVIVTRSGS